MAHTLPALPYAFDALEPYIDATTMEIHHDKHHQAYITKLVEAISGKADLEKKPAEELVSNLSAVPESIRTAVRNHGGGHVNHSFFWQILKKDVKFAGPAADAITRELGGFDQFKEKFTAAAVGQFGSGWAWLVVNGGKLEIMSTANQDSPLSAGKKPIVGVDVWEHAYYLKYQNKRPDYVAAFFNVINWEKVGELYTAATK
ncbi:MAG: superoxide dismutase [candidate division Zixibacteria bacterium]|jgi:Fe-Mn family superoxide dismutase|nr:superoxide dismutase [candidate division Zixibacteria bacterium]